MTVNEIIEQFDAVRGGLINVRREALDRATTVRLEAAQMFFCKGQVCAQVALVGSGSLRVFNTGSNGRELTLYHVQPGETCLVNVLSAFRQVPAPAAAAAIVADRSMERSEAFTITRSLEGGNLRCMIDLWPMRVSRQAFPDSSLHGDELNDHSRP